MSIKDIENKIAELKKKENQWMYERQIFELEAWLKYQKGCEERDKKAMKECSNCGNKALFIWWEPCKSCTPDKSNWKPKVAYEVLGKVITALPPSAE